MAEYRRQLGFVIQFYQQATVNGDLTSRQRPGVGDVTVQYGEFVGQVWPIADFSKFIADFLDIHRELGVKVEAATLGLNGRRIMFLTELTFLVLADQ